MSFTVANASNSSNQNIPPIIISREPSAVIITLVMTVLSPTVKPPTRIKPTLALMTLV